MSNINNNNLQMEEIQIPHPKRNRFLEIVKQNGGTY